ncbi:MAG: hypothetical protein Q8P10_00620 [bacterium]|nr:hypothetical protein [bacterium]
MGIVLETSRKPGEFFLVSKAALIFPGTSITEVEDVVTDSRKAHIVLGSFINDLSLRTAFDSLKGVGRTFLVEGRLRGGLVQPKVAVGFMVTDYTEGERFFIKSRSFSTNFSDFSRDVSLLAEWNFACSNNESVANFLLKCNAHGKAAQFLKLFLSEKKVIKSMKEVRRKLMDEILNRK